MQDPLTIAIVLLVIPATAAVLTPATAAVLIPAHRASRLDPMRCCAGNRDDVRAVKITLEGC